MSVWTIQNNRRKEKINSKIKKLNNSTFVVLIFEISTFRNYEFQKNERWDSIFLFYNLFLYSFKFFVHFKYMIIYIIENLWNFEFSKLRNFENLGIA